MTPRGPIDGKCILVAEDDYLLATTIKNDLVEHGATVIGPIADCAETLAILHDGAAFDAAILDINLCDGQIYEAADLLISHGRPFVLPAVSYAVISRPDLQTFLSLRSR
jgi:CheY-like chemotaxis protein